MAYYPESARALADQAMRSVRDQIERGAITASDWDIEGPNWTPDPPSGRVSYYSLALPSGNEVRLRYRTGTGTGYSQHQFSVVHDGAVLVEVSGDEAQEIVETVRNQIRWQLDIWRSEATGDFLQ